MSGGRRSIWLAAMATLAVALLLVQDPQEAAGRRGERRKESRRAMRAPGSERGRIKGAWRLHRMALRFEPAADRPDASRLMVLTASPGAGAGEDVRIMVRLLGSAPTARHVAFEIAADPSILEFLGYELTGRGALMVTPTTGRPGAVTVYRSSLPEGFSEGESLATLSFRVLDRGRSPLILSGVRLMDAEARDLPVRFEAGEVYVE